MIGELPKCLSINGYDKAIRCDTRTAFVILEALSDDELDEKNKLRVLLECLYVDKLEYDSIDEVKELIEKAIWFLNGGQDYAENKNSKRIMDWKQDEQIIFSAINKVAGREIRTDLDKIHWWTFLGFFNEIGQGLLSTIINIRIKRNEGKKLEKYEQEFYKKNRNLIDLKNEYTLEERRVLDKLNSICQ